jgi:hypothetical protein
MTAARIISRLRRFAAGEDPASRPAYIRNEVLKWLTQPGCMFCLQEQYSVRRFFFWYLHEGYQEPENLERMQRARGFCSLHTERLIGEGLPQTIASIYTPMISAAVEDLRRIEGGAHPERAAADVAPEGECPACNRQKQSRGYLLHYLQATIQDAEVQNAVRRECPTCLSHFLEIAPRLDWAELRFLADEIVRSLSGTRFAGVDRESPEGVLWGTDPREGLDVSEIRPGGAGRRERPDGSWSPVIDGLRRHLSVSGCPICRAQRSALGGYFEWLSVEILHAPIYQWNDAFWLCREHGRRFVRQGDGEAVAKLAEAVREYWTGELEKLGVALRRKPPDRIISRLAEVPERLREVRSAAGQGGRTMGSDVRQILKEALEPPRQVLAELRGKTLRGSPCPACVYLETTARRYSDLLTRGLSDPDTLRLYRECGGVCFRHLPGVLRLCRNREELDAFVRTQRAGLELVRWELREFLRKQSWTLRYEPKGAERDSWRRAVALYTGLPV